jgi:hypothetical protein
MAKATTTAATSPVGRTSAGLRDAIFDEIDAMRNGESNPTRANAVAKLAAGIVDTVRMDIEVQKFAQATAGKVKAAEPATSLPGSLSLGS